MFITGQLRGFAVAGHGAAQWRPFLYAVGSEEYFLYASSGNVWDWVGWVRSRRLLECAASACRA